MMMYWLSPVHHAATWALVGLIWTIQLVHYPLFAHVGHENFVRYHQGHSRRITWIVAPLMLAELGTAAGLLLAGTGNRWFLASLPLLAFNWVSTWLVQIPLHNKLATGFDPTVHGRLVTSNWWRTTAWSARALFLSLSSL